MTQEPARSDTARSDSEGDREVPSVQTDGAALQPDDSDGVVSPDSDGPPDEIDVDRGAFVGAMIGIAMFVTFQAMIVGSFQTGIIGGETPLWEPLMFAGITQGIYVFPTLLFFVNRKCPRMATGFTVVAAVIFVAGLAALIFA